MTLWFYGYIITKQSFRGLLDYCDISLSAVLYSIRWQPLPENIFLFDHLIFNSQSDVKKIQSHHPSA